MKYRLWSLKYSLRSLMIVVTLAALFLGGRIEYLRRWGKYHERESKRIAEEIALEQNLPSDKISLFLDPSDPFPPKFRGEQVTITESSGETHTAWLNERFLKYEHHRELAAQYRAAAYRPWTIFPEDVKLTP